MKIDFEFETSYGKFRDALYLPDDSTLTQTQIDAMKQERLDNWLFIVQNPPPSTPIEMTIDGVVYEQVEIDGQILLKPVGG